MKRLLAHLFIVLGLGLTFIVNVESGIIPFEPKANQIILINSNTNQILYEKNSDQKINPGSFTKLMTSIIVFDAIKNGQISLKDKLRVSKKAWKISTSGYAAMFVMNGDSISVENLLRGLIVASGNDAAIVLAEGLAGSENNFVKLMNDKAKKIGLNYTKFGNSTGIIIPTNTTTVKDVAIMSSYLINNYPELYYFFGEKQFTWNRTGGDPITQGNRNPLLYKNLGADGIKTGYLAVEKYSLASSIDRNGRRLIAVGSGFNSKNSRSKESTKLLTFGLTNYDLVEIARANKPFHKVDVWLGKEKSVDAYTNENIYKTIKKAKKKLLKVIVKYDGPVEAPIKKDQKIATLRVVYDQELVGEYDLLASKEIKKVNFLSRLIKSVNYLIWGDV